MEIQLIRTYHPGGVNGVLLVEGRELCKTIELPWRSNQPRISCIPEGQYLLRKRHSPRFRDHFEVMNVKDMYAAILAAGILGYVLNILFLVMERRIVHWSGR